MKKIIITAFAAIMAAGSASAAVSIKFTAGMTLLFKNDYSRGIQGDYDYYSDNFAGVTGEVRPFPASLNFGGEIIVPVAPRIDIGLGAGYFQAGRQSSFGYTWSIYSEEKTYSPRLSVMPLTLNVHYMFPLGELFKIDAYAGAGWYFTKFQHESTLKTDFFGYEEVNSYKARENVIGFQGGIGIELRVNSRLALVLRAEGRFAKISDPEGDLTEWVHWFLGEQRTESSDGSFWYYEKIDSGQTYPQIAFSKNPPSDPTLNNVRKGEIDLSGISVAAGLKVTF